MNISSVSAWTRSCSIAGLAASERTSASIDSYLLGNDLVEINGGLLRRRREPAFDALLHARHQDAVAQLLPALLRVVDGNDGPAAIGRAGGVEDLPVGQASLADVNCGERCVVLLPGAARE
jgi:hypothetical protein